MKYRVSRRSPRVAVVLTIIASAPSAAVAGEGPYIGVEAGPNWERPQNIRQDGATVDRLHFDTGWTAGLLGGYSFENGLRPELELNHRGNDVRDRPGVENADSLFANLWYDLKAASGPFSVVHPYLGFGVGAIRQTNHNVLMGAPGTSNDYATTFGYQLGAGVGFDLTENLMLSVGYRYINTDRGRFQVASGTPIAADYLAQTALVSLRYSFGAAHATPLPSTRPLPPAPSPIAAVPAPSPVPPPPCVPPAGFNVDADCHIIDQSVVVREVDFEFDSATLTLPAQQTLDDVATAFKAQPGLKVEIQGHTDSRGSISYNMNLSQRRAETVKGYLSRRGVDALALTAKGYGKSRPIYSNDTAEGRAENRRVAFKVTNVPAHIRVTNAGATDASTTAAEQGYQPKSKEDHR